MTGPQRSERPVTTGTTTYQTRENRPNGWWPWLVAAIVVVALVIAGFFLFGGDADVDVEPGSVDVESPEADADVEAPDVDVESPDVDVDPGSIDVDPADAEADASE